jgi:6,7-dimethyl-8-ribityllumazine synthase
MMRVFQATDQAEQDAVAAGRWAIVVSRYNLKVTQGLLQGALETLRARGVPEAAIDVFWVPGSFEIPTIAGHLARSGQYQAVLCLGAVIKGETTHDQHINRAVSLSLARLGVQTGVPVLFGVLTCNTLEQALARSGPAAGTRGKDSPESRIGNKGVECAEAALEMVALLRRMKEAGLVRFCTGDVGDSARAAHQVDDPRATAASRNWEGPDAGNGGSENPPRSAEASPASGQKPSPLSRHSHSATERPGDPSGGPASGQASAGVASWRNPPAETLPSAHLEEGEEPRPASPRMRAREAAFQILFHWDINPQFPLGELERFLWDTLRQPAAVTFARELIEGVMNLRDRLDQEIQSVAEHWTISRMSVTDRNVLRLGAYELLYTDTPSEVIIDQAVELAKRFGTSQSGAFVNGILDQLMRRVRGQEEARRFAGPKKQPSPDA